MRKQSLNLLTSIRGLAALWVVFYHIAGRLEGHLTETLVEFVSVGYLAVDVFFVLSGFVMALSYQKAFEQKTVTFRQFIMKRIARIYPLHIFVLILYLLIPFAFLITGRDVDVQRYSVESFIANLLLINSWGVIDQLSWNIPAWSISVEFFAYILFPFFVLLVARVKKLNHLVLLLLVTAIPLSFFFYVKDFSSISNGLPASGLIRCIFEFLMGIFTWNIYIKLEKSEVSAIRICMLLAAVYIGFILIKFSFNLPDYTIIGVASSILVLLCALLEVSFKLAVPRFFVWLGDISFSVYMLHYILRDIMKWFLPTGPTPLAWIVLYITLLLLLSHCCFHYVEKKSQRYLMNKLFDKTGKKT